MKGGKMRINEIFYSMQGEGHFTGTPAIFIRFSGCNLQCPFCDTSHATYISMTEEEIIETISQYKAKHVILTGGEPTLQINKELTDLLHEKNYFIQIETNGTLPIPCGCCIDWITCSPKHEGKLRLSHVDELKVLYHGDDKMQMSKYDNINAKVYSLQPLDTKKEDENKRILKETLHYILANPKWSLSLQTHKIIGIR